MKKKYQIPWLLIVAFLSWFLLKSVRAQQECCSSLKVSSVGRSQRFQSSRLGLYHQVGTLSSRPMYKNEERKEYLFYLTTRSRGLWMIGPNAGSFNGGVANRAEEACVEHITTGSWKYADGSGWKRDPDLLFECHYDPTECLYADDSILDGGDLYPDSVRYVSGTFECIRLCSSTPHCRYWTVDKLSNQTRHACHLKAWKGNTIPKNGFVSGSLPKACHETVESSPSSTSSKNSNLVATDDNACIYKNLEFEGGDLRLIKNSTSFEECREECSKFNVCSLFSYHVLRSECRLKSNQVSVRKNRRVSSGASPKTCKQVLSLKKRKQFFGKSKSDFKKYEDNEINGQFRITSENWDPQLDDPKSESFQRMSSTIKESLLEMIMEDSSIRDKAKFNITIVRFSPGSVVCNFKINYVLKEAYVAIPFIIKPNNVTNALSDKFKFKRGILFQRFVIASGSFKASSPVDHCDAMGCSHKCTYEYALEDYRCICPPGLYLDGDQKNCVEGSLTTTTTESSAESEDSELPENCLWSPWTRWSRCSSTCGPAVRSRARVVILPSKNGGSCEGDRRQERPCDLPNCPTTTTTTESSIVSTTSDSIFYDDDESTTEASFITQDEFVQSAESIPFEDLEKRLSELSTYYIINGIIYFVIDAKPYFISSGKTTVSQADQVSPLIIKHIFPDGTPREIQVSPDKLIQSPSNVYFISPQGITFDELSHILNDVSTFYIIDGIPYFVINGVPHFVSEGSTFIQSDNDDYKIQHTYPDGRLADISLDDKTPDLYETEIGDVTISELQNLLPYITSYYFINAIPYFTIWGKPHKVISDGQTEIIRNDQTGEPIIRHIFSDQTVRDLQLGPTKAYSPKESSKIIDVHKLSQQEPQIVSIQELEKLLPSIKGYYTLGENVYFVIHNKPYKIEPGKTEINFNDNGLPEAITQKFKNGTTYEINLKNHSILPLTTQTTASPRLEDTAASISPIRSEDVSLFAQVEPKKVSIEELEQLIPSISSYYEVKKIPHFVINAKPHIVHPGSTEVIPNEDGNSLTIKHSFPNNTVYEINLSLHSASTTISPQITDDNTLSEQVLKIISINELEELIPNMSAYYINDGVPYFVINKESYKIEPGQTEITQDDEDSALTIKHTFANGTLYEIKLGSSSASSPISPASLPLLQNDAYTQMVPEVVTIEELEQLIPSIYGYYIYNGDTYFIVNEKPYKVRPGKTEMIIDQSLPQTIRHTYPNGTIYEINIGDAISNIRVTTPSSGIFQAQIKNGGSIHSAQDVESITIGELEKLINYITGYYVYDGIPYFIIRDKPYKVTPGKADIIKNDNGTGVKIQYTHPDGSIKNLDLVSDSSFDTHSTGNSNTPSSGVVAPHEKEPQVVTIEELKKLLPNFSGYYMKNDIPYFIINDVPYIVKPGQTEILSSDQGLQLTIRHTYPNQTVFEIQLGSHSGQEKPTPITITELENLVSNITGYYITEGIPYFIINGKPYNVKPGTTMLIPGDENSPLSIKHTFDNGTGYTINLGIKPDASSSHDLFNSSKVSSQNFEHVNQGEVEVLNIDQFKKLIPNLKGYYVKKGTTYFVINDKPYTIENGLTEVIVDDDKSFLKIKHTYPNGTVYEMKLGNQPHEKPDQITIEELEKSISDLSGYYLKGNEPVFIIDGKPYLVRPGNTEIIPSNDTSPLTIKHTDSAGKVFEIKLNNQVSQKSPAPLRESTGILKEMEISPDDLKDAKVIPFEDLKKLVYYITGYHVYNGIPFFIINGKPHKVEPGKIEIRQNDNEPITIKYISPDGRTDEILLETQPPAVITTTLKPDKIESLDIDKEQPEDITFDELKKLINQISGYVIENQVTYFTIGGKTYVVKPGTIEIIPKDNDSPLTIKYTHPDGEVEELKLITSAIPFKNVSTSTESEDILTPTTTFNPVILPTFVDKDTEYITFKELVDKKSDILGYYVVNSEPYFIIGDKTYSVKPGKVDIADDKGENSPVVIKYTYPDGTIEELILEAPSESSFPTVTPEELSPGEVVPGIPIEEKDVESITIDELEKHKNDISGYHVINGEPFFLINDKLHKIEPGKTEILQGESNEPPSIKYTYPNGTVYNFNLRGQIKSFTKEVEKMPLNHNDENYILKTVPDKKISSLNKLKMISFEELYKRISDVSGYFVKNGEPYFIIGKDPYRVKPGKTKILLQEDNKVSIEHTSPEGNVQVLDIETSKLSEKDIPMTKPIINIDEISTTPESLLTLANTSQPLEFNKDMVQELTYEELKDKLSSLEGYFIHDQITYFIIRGKPYKIKSGVTEIIPAENNSPMIIRHIDNNGKVDEMEITKPIILEKNYLTTLEHQEDVSTTTKPIEFLNKEKLTTYKPDEFTDDIDLPFLSKDITMISLEELEEKIPSVSDYYVTNNETHFIIDGKLHKVSPGKTEILPGKENLPDIIKHTFPDGTFKQLELDLPTKPIISTTQDYKLDDTTTQKTDVITGEVISSTTTEDLLKTTTSPEQKEFDSENIENITYKELKEMIKDLSGYYQIGEEPYFIFNEKPHRVSPGTAKIIPGNENSPSIIHYTDPKGLVEEIEVEVSLNETITTTLKSTKIDHQTPESTSESDIEQTTTKGLDYSFVTSQKTVDIPIIDEKVEKISFKELQDKIPDITGYYTTDDEPYFIINGLPHQVQNGKTEILPGDETSPIKIKHIDSDGTAQTIEISSPVVYDDNESTTLKEGFENLSTQKPTVKINEDLLLTTTQDTFTTTTYVTHEPELKVSEELTFNDLKDKISDVTGYIMKDNEPHFIINGIPHHVEQGYTDVIPGNETFPSKIKHTDNNGVVEEIEVEKPLRLQEKNTFTTKSSEFLSTTLKSEDLISDELTTTHQPVDLSFSTTEGIYVPFSIKDSQIISFEDLEKNISDISGYYVVNGNPYFIVGDKPYHIESGETMVIPDVNENKITIHYTNPEGTVQMFDVNSSGLHKENIFTTSKYIDNENTTNLPDIKVKKLTTIKESFLTTTLNPQYIVDDQEEIKELTFNELKDQLTDLTGYYIHENKPYFFIGEKPYSISSGITEIIPSTDTSPMRIRHTDSQGKIEEVTVTKPNTFKNEFSTTTTPKETFTTTKALEDLSSQDISTTLKPDDFVHDKDLPFLSTDVTMISLEELEEKIPSVSDYYVTNNETHFIIDGKPHKVSPGKTEVILREKGLPDLIKHTFPDGTFKQLELDLPIKPVISTTQDYKLDDTTTQKTDVITGEVISSTTTEDLLKTTTSPEQKEFDSENIENITYKELKDMIKDLSGYYQIGEEPYFIFNEKPHRVSPGTAKIIPGNKNSPSIIHYTDPKGLVEEIEVEVALNETITTTLKSTKIDHQTPESTSESDIEQTTTKGLDYSFLTSQKTVDIPIIDEKVEKISFKELQDKIPDITGYYTTDDEPYFIINGLPHQVQNGKTEILPGDETSPIKIKHIDSDGTAQTIEISSPVVYDDSESTTLKEGFENLSTQKPTVKINEDLLLTTTQDTFTTTTYVTHEPELKVSEELTFNDLKDKISDVTGYIMKDNEPHFIINGIPHHVEQGYTDVIPGNETFPSKIKHTDNNGVVEEIEVEKPLRLQEKNTFTTKSSEFLSTTLKSEDLISDELTTTHQPVDLSLSTKSEIEFVADNTFTTLKTELLRDTTVSSNIHFKDENLSTIKDSSISTTTVYEPVDLYEADVNKLTYEELKHQISEVTGYYTKDNIPIFVISGKNYLIKPGKTEILPTDDKNTLLIQHTDLEGNIKKMKVNKPVNYNEKLENTKIPKENNPTTTKPVGFSSLDFSTTYSPDHDFDEQTNTEHIIFQKDYKTISFEELKKKMPKISDYYEVNNDVYFIIDGNPHKVSPGKTEVILREKGLPDLIKHTFLDGTIEKLYIDPPIQTVPETTQYNKFEDTTTQKTDVMTGEVISSTTTEDLLKTTTLPKQKEFDTENIENITYKELKDMIKDLSGYYQIGEEPYFIFNEKPHRVSPGTAKIIPGNENSPSIIHYTDPKGLVEEIEVEVALNETITTTLKSTKIDHQTPESTSESDIEQTTTKGLDYSFVTSQKTVDIPIIDEKVEKISFKELQDKIPDITGYYTTDDEPYFIINGLPHQVQNGKTEILPGDETSPIKIKHIDSDGTAQTIEISSPVVYDDSESTTLKEGFENLSTQKPTVKINEDLLLTTTQDTFTTTTYVTHEPELKVSEELTFNDLKDKISDVTGYIMKDNEPHFIINGIPHHVEQGYTDVIPGNDTFPSKIKHTDNNGVVEEIEVEKPLRLQEKNTFTTESSEFFSTTLKSEDLISDEVTTTHQPIDSSLSTKSEIEFVADNTFTTLKTELLRDTTVSSNINFKDQNLSTLKDSSISSTIAYEPVDLDNKKIEDLTYEDLKHKISDITGFYLQDNTPYFVMGSTHYKITPGKTEIIPTEDNSTLLIKHTDISGNIKELKIKKPISYKEKFSSTFAPNEYTTATLIDVKTSNENLFSNDKDTNVSDIPFTHKNSMIVSFEELEKKMLNVSDYYVVNNDTYFIIDDKPHKVEPGKTDIILREKGLPDIIKHTFPDGSVKTLEIYPPIQTVLETTQDNKLVDTTTQKTDVITGEVISSTTTEDLLKTTTSPEQKEFDSENIENITYKELKDMIKDLSGYYQIGEEPYFIFNEKPHRVSPGTAKIIPGNENSPSIIHYTDPKGLVEEIEVEVALNETITTTIKSTKIDHQTPESTSESDIEQTTTKGLDYSFVTSQKTVDIPIIDEKVEKISFKELQDKIPDITGYYTTDDEPYFIINGLPHQVQNGKTEILPGDETSPIKIKHIDSDGTAQTIEISSPVVYDDNESTTLKEGFENLSTQKPTVKINEDLLLTTTQDTFTTTTYVTHEPELKVSEELTFNDLKDKISDVTGYIMKDNEPHFIINGIPHHVEQGYTDVIPGNETFPSKIKHTDNNGVVEEIEVEKPLRLQEKNTFTTKSSEFLSTTLKSEDLISDELTTTHQPVDLSFSTTEGIYVPFSIKDSQIISFEDLEKNISDISGYYVVNGNPYFIVGDKPYHIESGETMVIPDVNENKITIHYTNPEGTVQMFDVNSSGLHKEDIFTTSKYIDNENTTNLPDIKVKKLTTIKESFLTTTLNPQYIVDDQEEIKELTFNELKDQLTDLTGYYIHENKPYFFIGEKPYSISSGITEIIPSTDTSPMRIRHTDSQGKIEEVTVTKPNTFKNEFSTTTTPKETFTTTKALEDLSSQDISTTLKPDDFVHDKDLPFLSKDVTMISLEELEEKIPSVSDYYVTNNETYFIIDGKPHQVSPGKTEILPSKENLPDIIKHTFPDGTFKQLELDLPTKPIISTTQDYKLDDTTTQKTDVITGEVISSTTTEDLLKTTTSPEQKEFDSENIENITYKELKDMIKDLSGYYQIGEEPYFIFNEKPHRVSPGTAKIIPGNENSPSIIHYTDPKGLVEEIEVEVALNETITTTLKSTKIDHQTPESTSESDIEQTTTKGLDYSFVTSQKTVDIPIIDEKVEKISFKELQDKIPDITGYYTTDDEPYFIINGLPHQVQNGKTEILPGDETSPIKIKHIDSDGTAQTIEISSPVVYDDSESTTLKEGFENLSTQKPTVKINEDLLLTTTQDTFTTTTYVTHEPELKVSEELTFNDLKDKISDVTGYIMKDNEPHFIINGIPHHVEQGYTDVIPGNDTFPSKIKHTDNNSVVEEIEVEKPLRLQENNTFTTESSEFLSTTLKSEDLFSDELTTTHQPVDLSFSTTEGIYAPFSIKDSQIISFEDLEKNISDISGYYIVNEDPYFVIEDKPYKVEPGTLKITPSSGKNTVVIEYTNPDGIKQFLEVKNNNLLNKDNLESNTVSSLHDSTTYKSEITLNAKEDLKESLSTLETTTAQQDNTDSNILTTQYKEIFSKNDTEIDRSDNITDLFQSTIYPSSVEAAYDDSNIDYEPTFTTQDSLGLSTTSELVDVSLEGIKSTQLPIESSFFTKALPETTSEYGYKYSTTQGSDEFSGVSETTPDPKEKIVFSGSDSESSTKSSTEEIIYDTAHKIITTTESVKNVYQSSEQFNEDNDNFVFPTDFDVTTKPTLKYTTQPPDGIADIAQNKAKPVTVEELEGLIPNVTAYYVIDGTPYFVVNDVPHFVEEGETILMPGDENAPFIIRHTYPNGTKYDISLGNYEIVPGESTTVKSVPETTSDVFTSEMKPQPVSITELEGLIPNITEYYVNNGTPIFMIENKPYYVKEGSTSISKEDKESPLTIMHVFPNETKYEIHIGDLSGEKIATISSLEEKTSTLPSILKQLANKNSIKPHKISIDELQRLIPYATNYYKKNDVPYFVVYGVPYYLDDGRTIVKPGKTNSSLTVLHTYPNETRYEFPIEYIPLYDESNEIVSPDHLSSLTTTEMNDAEGDVSKGVSTTGYESTGFTTETSLGHGELLDIVTTVPSNKEKKTTTKLSLSKSSTNESETDQKITTSSIVSDSRNTGIYTTEATNDESAYNFDNELNSDGYSDTTIISVTEKVNNIIESKVPTTNIPTTVIELATILSKDSLNNDSYFSSSTLSSSIIDTDRTTSEKLFAESSATSTTNDSESSDTITEGTFQYSTENMTVVDVIFPSNDEFLSLPENKSEKLDNDAFTVLPLFVPGKDPLLSTTKPSVIILSGDGKYPSNTAVEDLTKTTTKSPEKSDFTSTISYNSIAQKTSEEEHLTVLEQTTDRKDIYYDDDSKLTEQSDFDTSTENSNLESPKSSTQSLFIVTENSSEFSSKKASDSTLYTTDKTSSVTEKESVYVTNDEDFKLATNFYDQETTSKPSPFSEVTSSLSSTEEYSSTEKGSLKLLDEHKTTVKSDVFDTNTESSFDLKIPQTGEEETTSSSESEPIKEENQKIIFPSNEEEENLIQQTDKPIDNKPSSIASKDVAQTSAEPITIEELERLIPEISSYYIVNDVPHFIVKGKPYYVNVGKLNLIPGDQSSPIAIKYLYPNGTGYDISFGNNKIASSEIGPKKQHSIIAQIPSEELDSSDILKNKPQLISINDLVNLHPDIEGYYILNGLTYFVINGKPYFVKDGETKVEEGDDKYTLHIVHQFPNGTKYNIELQNEKSLADPADNENNQEIVVTTAEPNKHQQIFDLTQSNPSAITIEELENLLPGITAYYEIDGLTYFIINRRPYYVESGTTGITPGDEFHPFTIQHTFPNQTQYVITLGNFSIKPGKESGESTTVPTLVISSEVTTNKEINEHYDIHESEFSTTEPIEVVTGEFIQQEIVTGSSIIHNQSKNISFNELNNLLPSATSYYMQNGVTYFVIGGVPHYIDNGQTFVPFSNGLTPFIVEHVTPDGMVKNITLNDFNIPKITSTADEHLINTHLPFNKDEKTTSTVPSLPASVIDLTKNIVKDPNIALSVTTSDSALDDNFKSTPSLYDLITSTIKPSTTFFPLTSLKEESIISNHESTVPSTIISEATTLLYKEENIFTVLPTDLSSLNQSLLDIKSEEIVETTTTSAVEVEKEKVFTVLPTDISSLTESNVKDKKIEDKIAAEDKEPERKSPQDTAEMGKQETTTISSKLSPIGGVPLTSSSKPYSTTSFGDSGVGENLFYDQTTTTTEGAFEDDALTKIITGHFTDEHVSTLASVTEGSKKEKVFTVLPTIISPDQEEEDEREEEKAYSTTESELYTKGEVSPNPSTPALPHSLPEESSHEDIFTVLPAEGLSTTIKPPSTIVDLASFTNKKLLEQESTIQPILDLTTSSPTVLSFKDDILITTTTKPETTESSIYHTSTPLTSPDEGFHTLTCTLHSNSETSAPNVPLNCLTETLPSQNVTVLISKKDLDINAVIQKNLKIIVKEFMLMPMVMPNNANSSKR